MRPLRYGCWRSTGERVPTHFSVLCIRYNTGVQGFTHFVISG